MDFVSATVPRAQPQIIKNIANRKVCSQRIAEGPALLPLRTSAQRLALLCMPERIARMCEVLSLWHGGAHCLPGVLEPSPPMADGSRHACCAELSKR